MTGEHDFDLILELILQIPEVLVVGEGVDDVLNPGNGDVVQLQTHDVLVHLHPLLLDLLQVVPDVLQVVHRHLQVLFRLVQLLVLYALHDVVHLLLKMRDQLRQLLLKPLYQDGELDYQVFHSLLQLMIEVLLVHDRHFLHFAQFDLVILDFNQQVLDFLVLKPAVVDRLLDDCKVVVQLHKLTQIGGIGTDFVIQLPELLLQIGGSLRNDIREMGDDVCLGMEYFRDFCGSAPLVVT